MKLRVAIAMIVLMGFSVVPAFAADSLGWGIEGGANFSKVTVSGADSTGLDISMKTGFAGGVFVSIPIAGMFSIEPQALYSQKHFKLNVVSAITSTQANDFLEVPVLAKWRFGGSGLYIVAGPSVSFLLRAKEQDATVGGQTLPDTDNKDQWQSTDFGIIGGVGIGTGKFGVEARYEAGLNNMNPSCNATQSNCLSSALTVKDQTISVLAHWDLR